MDKNASYVIYAQVLVPVPSEHNSRAKKVHPGSLQVLVML